MDLKKAQLAVENLGDTLVTLNMKLVVQNDLKTDVQQAQAMHSESEQFRDQLHEQIRTITEKNGESAQRYQ